jgi:hypothetical protein
MVWTACWAGFGLKKAMLTSKFTRPGKTSSSFFRKKKQTRQDFIDIQEAEVMGNVA